jgi:hypothetical protein
MSIEIFDYITNFKNPIMWKHVIIHHSLTKDGDVKDWTAIRNYHVRGLHFDDIGYHAGIELVNGKLEYQIGRPLDMQGAHTLGMNDVAVGICVVGNFDKESPAKQQYWLLALLCKAFMRRFGIPIQNINFHRDFADKSCPGRRFEKMVLRDFIRTA